MKVIVLQNFHVFVAEMPGQPEGKVEYRKGMVLSGLRDDIVESWVAKGLVRLASPPRLDAEEPAAGDQSR